MAINKRLKRRLTHKLPMRHENTLGKLNLTKGKNDEGLTTYSWDVVQKCRHERCPALKLCSYGESILEGGDCKVMKSYLRGAALAMYENQKGLTQSQRYRIGMHIMPLYRQLVRMKIEEIGLESASYISTTGNPGVHPVYKEIRETIKAIESTWRAIGIQELPMGIKDIDFEGGSYYDEMEKEALREVENA